MPARFTSLLASHIPEMVRNWYLFPYQTTASPIIVGGCDRSGTNLLRALLDSHPDVCCGPETKLFALDIPDPIKAKDTIVSLDLPSRLSWLYDLPENNVIELWDTSVCLAEFIECFFYLNCTKHNAKIWAEKTPGNIQNLDWIFYYWPQAKVIHIIRDGRDVACSLRHHPKFQWIDGMLTPTNCINKISDCVKRWIRNVRAGRVWLGKPNYYEIRYEDIVSAPQETLMQLFSWLGLPWDPAVLNFYKHPRELEKAPNADGFQKPLYATSISRWTRELSYDELVTVRNLAGDLLVDLGYASDHWAHPQEVTP